MELEKLEAGDKEILAAHTEINTRNIQAMLDHGNETRLMLRDAEVKILKLEQHVLNQNEINNELRRLISALQQQMYVMKSA